MNLNKQNFVKYIIFLGVIYAALKMVDNNETNKRRTLLILVGSLLIMICTDCMFNKSEEMTNVWEQAEQLDNIDLSFDSPDESQKTLDDLKVKDELDIKPISNEEKDEVKLIKLTEEEEEEEESKPKSKKMSVKDLIKNVKKMVKDSVDSDVVEKVIKEEIKNKGKVNLTKVVEKVEKENVKPTNQVDMSLNLTEKTDCTVEVAKMKRRLELEVTNMKKELRRTRDRMNSGKHTLRYMNMLVKNLKKKGIVDKTDVENLNAKLDSKLLTTEEIIESLEKLTREGKPRKNIAGKKMLNSMKYSERPEENYEPIGQGVSDWSNEYTLLNTDKWKVPMTRPPVCISNSNCKVCPTNTDGYPVGLKNWDNSRRVTNMKINKKWANDQVDTSNKKEIMVEIED